MKDPAASTVASARWLVAVIASVVLSFLLATILFQYVSGAVESRTNELISNAIPSIKTLSGTRGDLHQLENHIDRYPLASADERSELAAQIATERKTMAANLALYAALPLFPGERLLYSEVHTN